MKRTPQMKLFSPKFRTWIGQWNVRTLYESGKVAQLAAEMRRYRLEILGVSEARWNQFGETELATGELFLYSGKENKDDVHERGVGIMLSGPMRRNALWNGNQYMIALSQPELTPKSKRSQSYSAMLPGTTLSLLRKRNFTTNCRRWSITLRIEISSS